MDRTFEISTSKSPGIHYSNFIFGKYLTFCHFGSKSPKTPLKKPDFSKKNRLFRWKIKKQKNSSSRSYGFRASYIYSFVIRFGFHGEKNGDRFCNTMLLYIRTRGAAASRLLPAQAGILYGRRVIYMTSVYWADTGPLHILLRPTQELMLYF